MAKSQLKQLNASLRAQGLVGPQASKKKGKKGEAVRGKQDQMAALQSIREQFNPFETSARKRQKHQIIGGQPNAVVKPGITKQVGEEQRRRAFEVEKRHKNKAGGVVDRRFGERNKHMSQEDKMLARFERERLSATRAGGEGKRKSLFSLGDGSDDEDNAPEYLTHKGNSLSLGDGDDGFEGTENLDDFDEYDDDEQDSEMEEVMRKRRAMTVGHEDYDGEVDNEQPAQKKTKKEIMNEIIMKSKKYKAERQIIKNQDEQILDELDEGLDDMLSELHKSKETSRVQAPAATDGYDYDRVVRELNFERRAQPADRTQTEAEIAAKEKERLTKLQKQREERMEAASDAEDEELHGDYLGDNTEFGLADYVEEDVEVSESEGEGESQSEAESEDDTHTYTNTRKPKTTSKPAARLPSFDDLMGLDHNQKPATVVAEALRACDPGKAEGNKQRIIAFTPVLAHYIIEADISSKQRNKLLAQLQKLAPDAVVPVSEFLREYTQDELENSPASSAAHLRAYTLVGILFSTSDHFHLVATAASLAACETLVRTPLSSIAHVASGIYLCDLLAMYQRHSKRYMPEVVTFICRALWTFMPAGTGLADVAPSIFEGSNNLSGQFTVSSDGQYEPQLAFNSLETANPTTAFVHLLTTIDTFSSLWGELSAWAEIFGPVIECLNHTGQELATKLAERLSKKRGFNTRERPALTLQSHKPIPLQTIAPKFEVNFNPEKKSYDPDQDRQSVSKLKAEIKKERKGAVRDIRRDNAFIAREKISARRKQDAEYHQKLARLERSIATEEGTEKNKYEREKKARKRASRK